MRTRKVLDIYFQNFSEFKKEIMSAISKKKAVIQPVNRICFESVASFRNFMTIQKIEILNVISTQKPNTIYGLAKLVGRDFAGVLRDCISLETVGFIKLKESKDARGSKKPILSFPY